MTAQIALMNKRAIALATDSAVTIGNGDKFYNTAEKLFMLSKFSPVSIMVYNNAEFMGLPWEIIIKQYREHIKDNEFSSINDYCDSFFDYLKSDNFNFLHYEERFIRNTIKWFLDDLNSQIQKAYNDIAAAIGCKPNEEQIKVILNSNIENYYNIVNDFNDLNNLPENYDNYINTKYSTLILELINSEIPVTLISDEYKEKLKISCIKVFKKEIRESGYSGLVIAGFGKKDVFPILVSFEISGIINGYIKYIKNKHVEINTDNDFAIVPFAQTDTVDTFLTGISPSYLNVINRAFNTQVISAVDELDEAILGKIHRETLKNTLNERWRDLTEEITAHSNKTYLFPILRAIRVLPKDELASMAESLVNLTSFKRQVAVDEYSQTVGGPIDVAIISKGDGFVWIKRKHYFKPELNHHFFENYYNNCREVDSNE
ncbi:MAG: hypothetical protein N3I35_04790 [Clostridia bacterium]|nr:hypothetical protein [Clostridia bacterium]